MLTIELTPGFVIMHYHLRSKKRHTKVDTGKDTSDLICGRIAVGEKYNLTRDRLHVI